MKTRKEKDKNYRLRNAEKIKAYNQTPAYKSASRYYHLSNGYSAHRSVYEYYNGSISKGMIIMHSCDNTNCINPKHLILGTNKDNTQDMIYKNRQVKRGHVIRLTRKEIKEIYLSNKSSYDLAQIYPISDVQIRRIKNGSRCKSITNMLNKIDN